MNILLKHKKKQINIFVKIFWGVFRFTLWRIMQHQYTQVDQKFIL